MKLLLTFILALFALTVAVPAAAVPGNCSMSASSMQGMAMPADTSGGKRSCCDHSNMACAVSCDMTCTAAAVTPVNPVPDHVQSVSAKPLTMREAAIPSVDFASIDPPPKTAG